MPNATAVFLSYSWFAFNALRTATVGIGVIIGLSLGTLALDFGSTLGLASAIGSVGLLILALWLVWRSGWQEERVPSDSRGARASILSVQRQAKFQNFRRWISAFGAVLGASLILFVSILVFFGGSPLAGFMFFCSGFMAMRAAWTLVRGQRSIQGHLG